jgi:hypothetical protein
MFQVWKDFGVLVGGRVFNRTTGKWEPASDFERCSEGVEVIGLVAARCRAVRVGGLVRMWMGGRWLVVLNEAERRSLPIKHKEYLAGEWVSEEELLSPLDLSKGVPGVGKSVHRIHRQGLGVLPHV